MCLRGASLFSFSYMIISRRDAEKRRDLVTELVEGIVRHFDRLSDRISKVC